jgi:uncharacterized MAPEG superfamily protein
MLLAVFAMVCALLVLKAQVLGAATAARRGKLKLFLNEEDALWLGGEQARPDAETVDRIFRSHRNDLENLLPFFIGGTLYIAAKGPVVVGVLYFTVFLMARVAHTYAYLAHAARCCVAMRTPRGGW